MVEIDMKKKAKEDLLNQQKLLRYMQRASYNKYVKKIKSILHIRSCINSIEKEAADVVSLKNRVETEFKLEQEKCFGAHKDVIQFLPKIHSQKWFYDLKHYIVALGYP